MVNDEKHNGAGVVIADDPNHKKPSRYYAAPHNTRRTISATIFIILLLVGITALVLWIIYRPQKNPRFTVVGVTIYGAVNTITAIQFAIITKNPNNRVSIYYDHLAAFLSYNNHPITPQLMLPPLHHERASTVVMTPIWPVSPVEVNGLLESSDNNAVGVGPAPVSLRVVLTGKLRWKAGDIMKTRRKRVYVGCDVLVGLKRGVLGQVPLVGSSTVCNVDI